MPDRRMTPADLLAHLRRRSRPTGMPACDHVAAATAPLKADGGDETTPEVREVPGRSETPTPDRPAPIGQVWPSPRTWQDPRLTEADKAEEYAVLGRLADLTRKLGDPLAAAQHEFAPHLRKDHPDA